MARLVRRCGVHHARVIVIMATAPSLYCMLKEQSPEKKYGFCDINPSSLPNKVLRTFFNGLSYPTSIVGNSDRPAWPGPISYSGCTGPAHVPRP
jgi:hypothetical protein